MKHLTLKRVFSVLLALIMMISLVVPTLGTSAYAANGNYEIQIGETVAMPKAEGNATWSTSNSSVASVSNDGIVTGVGEGTATITVTIKEEAAPGASYGWFGYWFHWFFSWTKTTQHSYTVTVVKPVQPEEPGASFELKVGETLALPKTANGAQWSSSDNQIATVSNDGVVTGVKAGTVTITETVKEAAASGNWWGFFWFFPWWNTKTITHEYTITVVNADEPQPPEETPVPEETPEPEETLQDTDGDQLPDVDEANFGTDPLKMDTDEDGLSDFEEIILGTNPLEKNDYNSENDGDGDGISDLDEVHSYGTDPFVPDTDGDGLLDQEELNVYHTDASSEDTDNDGLSDGFEVQHGLDPKNPCTDGVNKDGEVEIQQIISEDGISLQLLDHENSAIPSVSGKKAGELADNVFLSTAGDPALNENRAVIGDAVSVIGKDAYVNGLDLAFDLTSYEGETKFLTVAFVNEKGVFEPISSVYNGGFLTGTIEKCGTYCVLDMQEFLTAMGIDLSFSQSESAAAIELRSESADQKSSANNQFSDGRSASVLSVVDLENNINRLNTKNVSLLSNDVSGQADIVFAVDTTGSMSGAINNVIVNISSFAETLAKEYNVQINYALIDFKDLEEDGPNTTVIVKNGSSNWFSNVETFTSQVAKLNATGGGDEPECDIDALETARRLDFRPSANKFIILITDTYYKNANSYGITSMDEEIELLERNGIITSVVTSSSYESYYMDLYKKTGGIFTNINGDFSSSLLSLANLIGENTSNGKWVILEHGFKYVKLTEDSDQDGDGLSTAYELGESYTLDLTPIISKYLTSCGIPESDYTGIKEVTVCKAISDPTLADTDGDGIPDNEDTAPWKKGMKGGVVGSLTIVSCYTDASGKEGLTAGHSFLVYNSNCINTMNFSNFIGGASTTGTLAELQWDDIPVETFYAKRGEYTSMGGFQDKIALSKSYSGSGNGVYYNLEFRKYLTEGLDYLKNVYLTKPITQSQLEEIVTYMSGDSMNYWTLTNHNCSTIACKAWNKIHDTNLSATNLAGIDTPSALKKSILSHDGLNTYLFSSFIQPGS